MDTYEWSLDDDGDLICSDRKSVIYKSSRSVVCSISDEAFTSLVELVRGKGEHPTEVAADLARAIRLGGDVEVLLARGWSTGNAYVERWDGQYFQVVARIVEPARPTTIRAVDLLGEDVPKSIGQGWTDWTASPVRSVEDNALLAVTISSQGYTSHYAPDAEFDVKW